ncbi:MAG: hypothetical protein HGA53_07015, partial [Anaerolineaceae bacterium]|nr:hypothetical protein [Anaerolineaceae bacterium]
LFWVNSLFIFYVIGAGAGFALTGVQSVSRTMVGQYSPVEYSAEYFSLFSTAGLVASFIGPTLYGFVTAGIAKGFRLDGIDPLLAEQMGTRYAVIAIVAFLVFGAVSLLFVKDQHKKAQKAV